MLMYPEFSPEAFRLGPIAVRWYGLMYLFGFFTAWLLGRQRTKTHSFMTPARFEDLLTYGICGVILGGRLGYVLFYDLATYVSHPASIFAIWEGGMSFHGGLLGVLIAMALWARRMKLWGKGYCCLQCCGGFLPHRVRGVL